MHVEKISWTVHTRSLLKMVWFAALCLSWPAFGDQEYVSQFNAYGGYALLASPDISLVENGFAAQFGFQPKTWYVLGVDYSISSGDTTLTPGSLTKTLQQQLGAQLGQLAAEGQLPPGYQLRVPTHSRTQTFVAGAQLVSHHFTHVTLFLRPVVFGAVHESAALHPTDPIGAVYSETRLLETLFHPLSKGVVSSTCRMRIRLFGKFCRHLGNGRQKRIPLVGFNQDGGDQCPGLRLQLTEERLLLALGQVAGDDNDFEPGRTRIQG
jgi:hypothetical protein